jgi:hypothetical protein
MFTSHSMRTIGEHAELSPQVLQAGYEPSRWQKVLRRVASLFSSNYQRHAYVGPGTELRVWVFEDMKVMPSFPASV